MKVLLIQPPEHSRLGLQAFMLPEPLGLETVAANLIPEHEVHILDMRLESDLRAKLPSIRPDAIGVTASFTADLYNTYRVLDIVRDYNSHLRTFVGGHHATMCHSDFAKWADVVVLGEGEITAPELLRFWEQGRPLHEVAGIAFQNGDSWIQTQPRTLIKNLDESPLPARHLAAKYQEHYFHGRRRPCAYIETSRGCPYHCKFCSVWRFHQGAYRAHSPERVSQELSQVEAPHVFFTDDNFLADASRARRLLRAIRQAGISKHYIMQLRADSIIKHREVLAKWVEAGLETVFVGLESITQKRLDALGKQLSLSQIEGAIRIVRELGINLMSSFIVDPDFREEDFTNLRRFVNRMKLRLPVFSVLTPLPGTVLYEEQATELTTSNYELFDLHHAVLPTSLSLKRFYKEYVKLCIRSYLSYVSPNAVSHRLGVGSVCSFFKLVWTTLNLIKECNPHALVRNHYQRRPAPTSKPARREQDAEQQETMSLRSAIAKQDS